MENAKCYAPQILVGTEGLPREQWLEYPSSSSIGSRLYLGALINFNDVNRGVKTSGQWSTDAAR